MSDSANFEFKAWCQEYELEEDTVQCLMDKGFKSYRSLSLLSIDDIKKDFKKLLPAQLLLLQQAVGILHGPVATPRTGQEAGQNTSVDMGLIEDHTPPAAEVPATAAVQSSSTNGQASPSMSIQDILQLCGLTRAKEDDAGTYTSNPPSSLAATDPYGFGSGPHGNRHRDIGKFVTNIAGKADEDSVVSIGGVQFTMTGDKKVPLEKIKIQQYMEGSLSILRTMVLEESMPLQGVLDHINYLIQVSRFAQTFSWSTVLNYDAIYRKQQSELGFRWGMSSSTLMQTQLRVETIQQTANKSQPQTKDPKTGKTICQRWNGKFGCTLQVCNFAHVCRTCFSSEHSQYRHHQEAAGKK